MISYHIYMFNKPEKNLKITKVNLEHSHPITPQIYSMYPKNRQANNSEMEIFLKLFLWARELKKLLTILTRTPIQR